MTKPTTISTTATAATTITTTEALSAVTVLGGASSAMSDINMRSSLASQVDACGQAGRAPARRNLPDVRTTLHLLAVLATLGALVSLAEWADPEVGRFRRRENVRDLGWLLLYAAYAPFVAIGSVELARAIRRHSPLDSALDHAGWVRVVIAVLVAEATYYWLHRLFHASRVGWWVHRVHHSSTDLHWWSAFRFHPVEVVVTAVVPAAVGAWCGAGSAAAVYSFAATVVTTFAHADVYVPGRALDHVVCTPGYHRTHHETGRERCNYALVLPLADLVFRTADFRRGDPRRFGSLRTAAPPPSATHCWPALPQ